MRGNFPGKHKLRFCIKHLGYHVFVHERPQDHPSYASHYDLVSKNGNSASGLVLPKRVSPSALAHELVHVLQHICKTHNMNFLEEREHMAYLMQFMFETIYPIMR